MFIERLNSISNRIEGAVALSLVARDGIPVESVSSVSDLDLEALAAELITQVKAMSDDHRELAVGTVRQFAVTTETLTLMVNSVTDEYFLLLAMNGDGNYGRARFELRRASLLLEEDLL